MACELVSTCAQGSRTHSLHALHRVEQHAFATATCRLLCGISHQGSPRKSSWRSSRRLRVILMATSTPLAMQPWESMGALPGVWHLGCVHARVGVCVCVWLCGCLRASVRIARLLMCTALPGTSSHALLLTREKKLSFVRVLHYKVLLGVQSAGSNDSVSLIFPRVAISGVHMSATAHANSLLPKMTCHHVSCWSLVACACAAVTRISTSFSKRAYVCVSS